MHPPDLCFSSLDALDQGQGLQSTVLFFQAGSRAVEVTLHQDIVEALSICDEDSSDSCTCELRPA